MRWPVRGSQGKSMSRLRLSTLVAVFLLVPLAPAIAQKVHKGAQACMQKYNDENAALEACMADYTSLVRARAEEYAQKNIERDCEKIIEGTEYPQGPPKKPKHEPISLQDWVAAWHYSVKDYDSYLARFNADEKATLEEWQQDYDRYQKALAVCEDDRRRPPTADEYSGARVWYNKEFGKCFDHTHAQHDPDYGRECTGLLGKDMVCELYKKLVSLCSYPTCDVKYGHVSERFARKCQPWSKFPVNTSGGRTPSNPAAPVKGAASVSTTKSDADKVKSSATKNNLDRFGLGPTFVDTSTSQAGTRTTPRGAAAAVKGGAVAGGKMKATTQQDVGSQSSGGGTSPQQKTIVIPAQKEFLGKPIIEPK